MQQRTRSDDGRQLTLGVDIENESKGVGSQRNSEKEEVQGEILVYQEEQCLPKELHEGGCQEVVMSGYGASKNVVSTCGGGGSYRKIKIEEADGSSSRQKEHDLVVIVFGSVWP